MKSQFNHQKIKLFLESIFSRWVSLLLSKYSSQLKTHKLRSADRGGHCSHWRAELEVPQRWAVDSLSVEVPSSPERPHITPNRTKSQWKPPLFEVNQSTNELLLSPSESNIRCTWRLFWRANETKFEWDFGALDMNARKGRRYSKGMLGTCKWKISGRCLHSYHPPSFIISLNRDQRAEEDLLQVFRNMNVLLQIYSKKLSA